MDLPKPQQYRAKFEDKEVYNERFTHFKFELLEPSRLEFVAGQYISLKVSELGERRSYSISSSPGIQHGIETLVDLKPGGLGSAFLSDLNFGDEVEFLAPLGQFVVDKTNSEEEVVFVATGSGISPLRSMILDLLQEEHDSRPIYLYWGMRYVDQLFWMDEFTELVEAFENFNFTPILSRPPEEWPLSRGRVTDIFAVKDINPQAGFYLCGNEQMIKDVSAILQKKGVPVENIHHEQFY